MENERPAVSKMTDREIAEETLMLLRLFADTLSALSNHPMAAMMVPGFPNAMQV